MREFLEVSFKELREAAGVPETEPHVTRTRAPRKANRMPARPSVSPSPRRNQFWNLRLSSSKLPRRWKSRGATGAMKNSK
jgi:hypothetical protein